MGRLPSYLAEDDDLAAYYVEREGAPLFHHPLCVTLAFEGPARSWIEDNVRSRRALARGCLERQEAPRFVSLHEKPYRAQALALLAASLELAEVYWPLVRSTWIQVEYPGEDFDLWQRIWLRDLGGLEACMTPQELAAYKALPEAVTVYRGQAEGQPLGLSWTLDLDIANWFAARTQALRSTEAEVLALTLPKSAVRAVLLSRNEAEVVVPDIRAHAARVQRRQPAQADRFRRSA